MCLDIETSLFEVPIKKIGEEIKKLKDTIIYQKDKCVNPPSMEWCYNNAVKHKGWHAESILESQFALPLSGLAQIITMDWLF